MSRLGQSWLALLLTTLCACSTTSQAPAPGDANHNKPSLLSQANQFAREGLLREAVDGYKKVIAKEPENMVARRNLGIVLLKAGDPKGAIINLESVIKNFEQNFETNFFLAEAYRAEDKYAEAIYRYKKSLKIKPEETRALKSLAWSYFKIRFYSEAINIATKLQKKAPNDEQALMIFARP
jgi:tetratricopeptide (TPR) repeat protein